MPEGGGEVGWYQMRGSSVGCGCEAVVVSVEVSTEFLAPGGRVKK